MFRSICNCAVMLIAVAAPLQAMDTYHVGNSLTWDSRPMWMDAFAAQKGLPMHNAGWHIRCGSSLTGIVTHPTDVCADPAETFGMFSDALTDFHWDAITIQSYPGTTLGSENAAALALINLVQQNPDNLDTPFYLMTGWPPSADYVSSWNQIVADEDYTISVNSRQYHQLLLQRLRSQTDADIYLIPTGEVLYQLNLLILDHQLPGFTSIGQFFRDGVHLTPTVGRYVAATTMFAALYGQSPAGLVDPELVNPYDSPYSPELYDILNQVVWDVVSKYSDGDYYRHPGDANEDNKIDLADLQILGDNWLASNASWNQGDFTGDGLVDLADLQILGDRWPFRQPGDANLDGKVDLADLQILTDNWLASSALWAQGDFNNDGLVNLADLQLISDNWGYQSPNLPAFDQAQQTTSLPIPEPAAATIALLSLCLTCTRLTVKWGGRL
ncbi:MAG: hypothetical protein IT445_13995 [Phycisphaeraceae bacterium]|nr:hypothetical protein [Phycisphaeraceae bacterium]